MPLTDSTPGKLWDGFLLAIGSSGRAGTQTIVVSATPAKAPPVAKKVSYKDAAIRSGPGKAAAAGSAGGAAASTAPRSTRRVSSSALDTAKATKATRSAAAMAIAAATSPGNVGASRRAASPKPKPARLERPIVKRLPAFEDLCNVSPILYATPSTKAPPAPLLAQGREGRKGEGECNLCKYEHRVASRLN